MKAAGREWPCVLLEGDAREALKVLEPESVHCCVTSPPYYGLRAYQCDPLVWGGDSACVHQWGESSSKRNRWGLDRDVTEKQASNRGNAWEISQGEFCGLCGAWRGALGLEPTPDLYISHLVEVFREVRRVLRRDGTLFVVIGDSYAGGFNWRPDDAKYSTLGPKRDGLSLDNAAFVKLASNPRRSAALGLKPKDLIGVPWMFAFALRADGWYWRSKIVYHKTSPMPDSTTDRPTCADEAVLMFSKSSSYYYDWWAVREPSVSNHSSGNAYKRDARLSYRDDDGPRGSDEQWHPQPYRNKRSVWTLGPQPFPYVACAQCERIYHRREYGRLEKNAERKRICAECDRTAWQSHFASFGENLVEPMILAGSSEHGCCSKCGTPWVRTYEKTKTLAVHHKGSRFDEGRTFDRDGGDRTQRGERTITVATGWQPSCKCSGGGTSPAVVLDPFCGAGRSGLAALRLGRSYIGIDLSPFYLRLAERHIAGGLEEHCQHVWGRK